MAEVIGNFLSIFSSLAAQVFNLLTSIYFNAATLFSIPIFSPLKRAGRTRKASKPVASMLCFINSFRYLCLLFDR
jgi:hypothetical protein